MGQRVNTIPIQYYFIVWEEGIQDRNGIDSEMTAPLHLGCLGWLSCPLTEVGNIDPLPFPRRYPDPEHARLHRAPFPFARWGGIGSAALSDRRSLQQS